MTSSASMSTADLFFRLAYLPATSSAMHRLARLGPDLFHLLDGVSISRSRRQIRQFYEAEMDRIDQFPRQETPENHYPLTDLDSGLSYKELADLIDKFELSIYRPTRYLLDESPNQTSFGNFTQADRERFLIGMIKTNFLKLLALPHTDAEADRWQDRRYAGKDRPLREWPRRKWWGRLSAR